MSGLYIHIPFCERKCSYCAFYSVVSPSTELRTGKPWELQQRFFQSLEKELNSLPADFVPETIFIGGGTPTALTAVQIERLLAVIDEKASVSDVVQSHCRTRFPYAGACEGHGLYEYRDAKRGFRNESNAQRAWQPRPTRSRYGDSNSGFREYSCEANPGTVDAEKLAVLKKSGVNRLSIGVQSFDSQCLETLGRIHSADEAEAAFRMARSAGFDNISIDLMFGIPGQTLAMLESDLVRALSLDPEHIAIYNLMYEEGTPLTARNPQRLDEELEREMYDRIRGRLKQAGFVHYEISNFAKPGFECRHNLLYWSGGEYIGCGPSAHSHWQGTRWANVADLDDYCSNVGRARPPGAPLRTARRSVPTQADEEIPLQRGVADLDDYCSNVGRANSPSEPLSRNGGSPRAQAVTPAKALPEDATTVGRASLSERAVAWPPREFEETLDPEAKERETLVMGLRLIQGLEVSSNVWKKQHSCFQALEKAGLLIIEGHHVRLSEEALFVSDTVFAELV